MLGVLACCSDNNFLMIENSAAPSITLVELSGHVTCSIHLELFTPSTDGQERPMRLMWYWKTSFQVSY